MDSDGYPDVPAGFRVARQPEVEVEQVEAGEKTNRR
jgi:hypothetical protein